MKNRSLLSVLLLFTPLWLSAGIRSSHIELPEKAVQGDTSIPGVTLEVAPHPEYGEAWLAARDFLLQQGEDCRDLEWRHSDRAFEGTRPFLERLKE